jgi:RNA polymerase sigma-70 factor (ECF subfamily)
VKTGRAIHHDLRTLFEAGTTGGLSDGELLARFVARRDEPAFEALVRRHGPMVLGVCRRILRDHHDAEDAFQATFLVLARKAWSVRPAELLASWLYGVARQTAVKARAVNARRRSRERQVLTMPEPETIPSVSPDDLSALIDRELGRLPAKYRAPVILCDLEGLGHREAAVQLGLPVGTVSGRLSRARTMLARRLTRRGVALPAGTLALALGPDPATAGVPALLIRRTIEAAIPFAAAPAMASGVVSGPVAALTNRVLGGMMVTKLFAMAGVGLACGALLFGGIAGHRMLAGPAARGAFRPAARPVVEDAATKETRLLQGTWQGVDLEFDGKKAPAFEAKDLLMIFEGEDIIMKGVNRPAPPRGRGSRFKLDATRTPKAIDITPRDGQEAGQTAAAIYSLEKDRLMICIGKDPGRRPTEFQTRAGDGRALFVLERVGPKGPVDPGPRDPTMAGFEMIQRDYERAELEYQNADFEARTAEKRREVEAMKRAKTEPSPDGAGIGHDLLRAADAKRPKTEVFADRFLKLAQDRPDTREGLFALCWAVMNAPASDPGKKALAILEGGRLARADPGELLQALEAARTIQESLPSPLAPLVLERVERDLANPAGAGLLTWVCRNYFRSEWPEEPRTFAEAAALIVDRFADSPGIQNLCECLGSVDGYSPAWAGKYERHLRTIVDRNRDRLVLSMAKYALAVVVRNSGETRQDEAERLYESFIERFKDLSEPRTRGMEAQMIEIARREIRQIRDRKRNRPAQAGGPGR